MKSNILVILLFITFSTFSQSVDSSLINLSRKSTLKIIPYNKTIGDNGYGTGFFIDIDNTTFIITCNHVATTVTIKDSIAYFKNCDTIKGITWSGDIIDLTFVEKGGIPIDFLLKDYTVLRCNKLPKNITKLNLAKDNKDTYVGATTYFSGYPIGFNTMLTHIGFISGINDTAKVSNIFIQASVNSGNSGGALLNKNGNVIGIITFKSWQLALDFDAYLLGLKNNPNANITMGTIQKDGTIFKSMGTDFNRGLIETLKTNLNTGIGGAHSIKYLRKYLIGK